MKDAYLTALAGDPTSAFGGVLIANGNIDEATALEINKLFGRGAVERHRNIVDGRKPGQRLDVDVMGKRAQRIDKEDQGILKKSFNVQ